MRSHWGDGLHSNTGARRKYFQTRCLSWPGIASLLALVPVVQFPPLCRIDRPGDFYLASPKQTENTAIIARKRGSHVSERQSERWVECRSVACARDRIN